MYKPYTLADVHTSAQRKRFTYISTFAGGGGSSMGYKLAGGHLLAMNEFQQIAADTYKMNFPDALTICQDIRSLDVPALMKQIGIKEGELDILDGSPPCPPFSMAGKKRAGWGQTKKVYGHVQSNIEDLDFAKAISDFTLHEAVYNASLQTAARVLQPTLSDFI